MGAAWTLGKICRRSKLHPATAHVAFAILLGHGLAPLAVRRDPRAVAPPVRPRGGESPAPPPARGRAPLPTTPAARPSGQVVLAGRAAGLQQLAAPPWPTAGPAGAAR